MKKLLFTLAITLAVAGCKKDEQSDAAKAAPTADPSAAQTARKDPAPKPDDKPAPQADGDYVRVVANHAEKKPNDPVIVSIPSFEVVAADFDPQKVEGGTATLELDLTSISSGSAKRDAHLKNDDYLDTGKFGVATVKVANVKKTGDNAYSADATVSAHGVEKVLPVTFEVLETLPDGIRVKAAHTFARLDFGIGQAPGPDDSAAEQITLELELTLKKT